ncbi:MAG: energy transducer TonB [Cytophagales bacterium]|nr:energy transducer TonB [Cytophagales bacterium]
MKSKFGLIFLLFSNVVWSQCKIDSSRIIKFKTQLDKKYYSFTIAGEGDHESNNFSFRPIESTYQSFLGKEITKSEYDKLFYAIVGNLGAKYWPIYDYLTSTLMLDSINSRKLTSHLLCRFKGRYEEEIKRISKTIDPNEEYLVVEEYPEFPGGVNQLSKFIKKNLRYPILAKKENKEGRVIIKFIVNKSGKIDSPEIVKGIGFGCDEEALRLVKMMPIWRPGKHYGVKVNTIYFLNITFKMKEI